MVRRLLLLPALFFLLWFSPVVSAAEEGVIQGQVVNKTPGTQNSVEGITVTLNIYSGNTRTDSRTAETDAEGRFQFAGLSTDPAYSYQLALTYQEAEYNSTVQFGEGETSKEVEIAVYDATGDDSALTIPVAHMVIDIEQGNLTVWEMYSFYINPEESPYTYIGSQEVSGGRKETLRFPLPQGYADLQPVSGLMSCCVVFTAEGFSDTMAVIPGQPRNIIFSYNLKYSSSRYLLSRKMEYPVSTLNLLVQKRGVQVESDTLEFQGEMQVSPEISEVPYLRFSGTELAPGTVEISFSGLPHSSPVESLKWAVIVLAAIALGVGLSYPLLSKKRARGKVAVSPSPLQEREELLRQLARLDDEFEAGKIPEADYRRLREQKKARLIALTSRIKKGV
jgi:5-hydroxyisourate hydrolase-like protein (transthyretin family)